MLVFKDILNPNLTNKESSCAFDENMPLKDINLEELLNVQNEYINVTSSGKIIGAVKTERLCYLLRKLHEVQFVQILDSLEVGVVAIDRDSRIFYINPAYASILGVEVAKILGRYMSVIEPNAALLGVLENGQSVYKENQLIQSVNKYVSTNMMPMYEGEDVIGAFSIFTDTTQINLLHREVERISSVAEEYDRQIKDTAAIKNSDIIGESKAYLDCIGKAIKVSHTDAMILIRGENGSGKEVLAKLIQKNSNRKDKSFITVNCSAIPESLIESELFGYEEGAFTGANKGGKMGKFELADGGTIFLDEIGDMPFTMQAKLLRVLQEGEIEKVGRQTNIPIDVRVRAATNMPLERMVKEGIFREDLYYRLNVITVTIPPLRDRNHDVLLLAQFFLNKYNEKYHRNAQISKDVYQKLMEHSWPGNIRELKNLIESAVVLCDDEIIRTSDLPDSLNHTKSNNDETKANVKTYILEEESLKDALERIENEIIKTRLMENDGDKEKTIEELGISKRSFYRKIANNGTNKR